MKTEQSKDSLVVTLLLSKDELLYLKEVVEVFEDTMEDRAFWKKMKRNLEKYPFGDE